MQTTAAATGTGHRLWLAEHYWPDLDDAASLSRAARVQLVRSPVRWVSSLLLPHQRTVLVLFAAANRTDVVRALAEVDEQADRVDVALHISAADRPRTTNGRKPRT